MYIKIIIKTPKTDLFISYYKDGEFYLNAVSSIFKPNQSKGYSERLKRHNKWMSIRNKLTLKKN